MMEYQDPGLLVTTSKRIVDYRGKLLIPQLWTGRRELYHILHYKILTGNIFGLILKNKIAAMAFFCQS